MDTVLRAARGPLPHCRGWRQEAAWRMFMEPGPVCHLGLERCAPGPIEAGAAMARATMIPGKVTA